MKKMACFFLFGIVFIILNNSDAVSQVATGFYSQGSYSSGPDVVNLGNLNVNFRVPVFSKPGRGMPFDYELGIDTSVWIPSGTSGSQTWQPVGGWGWKDITEVLTGYVTFSSTVHSVICGAKPNLLHGTDTTAFNWVYHDRLGGLHPFTGSTDVRTGQCGTSSTSFTNLAGDGSGYTLLANGEQATIIAPDGRSANPPINNRQGAATTTDINGNQITVNSSNVFTDTLGMTVLTSSGSAPNPLVYTYTDSTNTARSVTVNYVSATVKTNFGCTGVAEYGPTAASLVSSIVYPDGSSYSFTYEPTPGFAGDVTGRLQSITLRTGATITYTYTGSNNGIICSDGSAAGLTRTTSDGATAYTRSGTGTTWTTTITDAQSNVTTINFQTSVPSGGTVPNFYETHRVVNQGASTPLITTDTCYNNAAPNCSSTAIVLPFTAVAKYVTLNNGQESEVSTTLNSFGLPTNMVEYDFGAGAPGQALRQTAIVYSTTLGNIVNHPSSITVLNGAGTTTIAQTTFGYDETAVTTTTGVPQHVAVSAPRGNLTSRNQWVNTSNTFLTTRFTYDDTGNVLSSTDPGSHQTQFSYTDNFSDGINRGSLAYLTQVTQPVTHSPNAATHVSSTQYEPNTGLVSMTTDQNGKQTTFTYDLMLRPLLTNFPDGGQTSVSYPSTTQTVVQNKIDSTRSTYSTTLLDTYGRTKRTAVANAESTPYDLADVCYDSNGRLAFQSYPYQASSYTGAQVCSGLGDILAYDGAGRLTQLTHSDTSKIQYSYNGRATQITDEGNGSYNVSRIQQMDALGRLTGVCEVTSVGLLGNGGTPSSCGLDITATGFLTSYGYDTLNNLNTVTQGSLATRTLNFDSLSRMTSESEPEWGTGSTTTYTYNSDSLLTQRTRPAPNQTNPAVTFTTTYSYDELHRLRGKSYSDGTITPAPTYNYDEVSPEGFTAQNTIGRPSSEESVTLSGSALAKAAFSYDSMGRIISNWQCNPQTCATSGFYPLNYQYDLFGNMTSLANATFVTLSYSYNSASRLTGITSSLSDINHPATLLSSLHYNQFGPVSDTLGNGINENFGYNTNGQFKSYSSTPNVYNFSLGFAPNWNIISGSDSVNGNWTYGYDQFNRLISSSQSNTPAQGFSYVYDRNGNRLQQNVTQGTGPAPQYTFDNNNRISGSGVTYDALGNVTNDGFHSYSYDGENRVSQVDGGVTATYRYDTEGKRVEGLNVEFIYDLAGHAVDILNRGDGSWAFGEIYAGGRHLGTYSAGKTNFLHTDWLGTKRVMTGVSGVNSETCTGLPFGDGASCTGTNWTYNAFTDDIHDSESNLEHTWFRQLSGTQGRWTSPDPYLGSMDLGNPQSLNRYVYSLNNPMSLIDPLGLDCAYFDDAGEKIESLDQDSNSEECGANGGYWVDGGLTDFGFNDDGSLWLRGTDGTNITNAFYRDDPTQGNIWTTFDPSSYFDNYYNQVRIQGIFQAGAAPTSEQYIRAIAAAAPTICGGGVFGYGGRSLDVGPASGFAGGIIEADSRSGVSRGALFEAGGGEGFMGGGGLIVANEGHGLLGSENLIYAGTGIGVPGAHVGTGLVGFDSGLGGYAEISAGGREVGFGVYLNITTNAGCIGR